MSKCRYFYPDGEEITKEQFIDFYSEVYCYENHKQWNLEVEMEKLLGRDNGTPLTTMEIARILLWKTNGTPEETGDDEFCIKDYGRTIIIRDELKESQEFKSLNEPERKTNETDEIDEIDEYSAKDFVRHLVNYCYPAPKSSGETGERIGIGFVYAATLLFFVTKGAYPIYDRYAHVGLKSVCSGENPTGEQCKITESYYYSKMFHSPDRNKKGIITDAAIDKAWKEYMRYKCLLMEKDVFGDVYAKFGTNYRDVDRALWAYGHLFYVS